MNNFLGFDFQFKSVDAEEGIIEGYASTFGNLDLGFDIVDRGAFNRTLQNSKGIVPILADHDPRKQIGWNLEAREDEKGLYVKGKLDIKNNALARERFSLVQQAHQIGGKCGLSIGYATIKAEPDASNLAIRHLKELKLFEYSMVTFPMNEEAMVERAKQWIIRGDNKPSLEMLVDRLCEFGYSEKEISSALEIRLAKQVTDPGPQLHSVIASLKEIENLLKPSA